MNSNGHVSILRSRQVEVQVGLIGFEIIRARDHSVVAIGSRGESPSGVLTLATTQIVKNLAWEGPAGENSVRAREEE